jgi:protein-S-isoprenylcysteine O-methyltransferase Ste14
VRSRHASIGIRVVAWAGALVFALSLGYFAYSYAIRFAAVTAGEPDAVAITWDVALFTIFALHHSVFARLPLRAWLTRRLPTLERSVYVWIASLLFIGVCWLWQPVGGLLWDVRGLAGVLSLALQATGIGLTLLGARALDFRELAGVTQAGGASGAGRAGRAGGVSEVEFKTTGPYGWVRHPIYLGWFLMVLPATPMTMTRLVFALVSCGYLVVAIPFEEGTLLRSSQGAYAEYIRKVKWRLIPGVY